MAFQPATPLFLSELTIPAEWDALHPLGELVAQLNADGYLLHPNFTYGFALSSTTGTWMLHEADYIAAGKFEFSKAAAQFQRFTGDKLRAILSGYAQQAQWRLDPRQPGFTVGLLAELLPAPVPRALPPLVSSFDLGAVLRACGASLHVAAAEDKLVFQLPAGPAVPLTDDELLLAAVVVLVAGLDLTAWLLHVAKCQPDSEMAQLLGALARGELFEPEWGGLIPQLLSYLQPKKRQLLRQRLLAYGPWSLLVQLFCIVYGRAGQLAEIKERNASFRFLRQALDQLPAEALARRGAILLAVRDGLHWLARTTDKPGQATTSLNFAQAALIAAQLLPPFTDPAFAEAWLVHQAAQEEEYSWFRPLAGQPPEPLLVWQRAAYAGSAALATRPFCQASSQWLAQGQVTNQLWSAAWRTLHLVRTALRACYTSSLQEPPGQPEPGHGMIIQQLTSRYSQLILLLLNMATRNVETRQVLSMWGRDKTEEVPFKSLFGGYPDRYHAVINAVTAHGYGPEAIQCLGELLAGLPA